MNLHRLSVNIFINLIFLLALAMVLINVVILQSNQRMMLRDEIGEGELLIAAVGQIINDDPAGRESREKIDTLLEKSDFCHILVLSPDGEELYCSGAPAPKHLLSRMIRNAISSGEKKTRFSGSAWGIFWEQKKNLTISAPLFKNDTVTAGVGIVLSFEKKYRELRQMQKLVIVYIFVNAFILTLIGLLRLSKITVKPLQKLVQSAETFNEESDVFLFSEKEGSEFNQLSRALNQMLHRISKSKAELKSTVEALKKANTELKKAQNDIINTEKLASFGRLSAGIAHEIGNPIAIILGYLELLKRNDITEEEREDFIRRTEKEINRVSRIIRQLLDISKPSADNAKRISVHTLLTDLVDVFKFQPHMSAIRLDLTLLAENDAVYADSSQLRQVFLNLIMNAVDAIHSASRDDSTGKIVISTRNRAESEDRPPWVEIRFFDNGPGIPRENLVRVFDPFYTTKAPGKGTGLGLSVCFMIIEAMKGKIKAAGRRDGEGAAMIVQLPSVNGETDIL